MPPASSIAATDVGRELKGKHLHRQRVAAGHLVELATLLMQPHPEPALLEDIDKFVLALM